MPKARSTKLDRRVARTRLALRDAMLHLLKDRGWDELRIQEICEQANIGRSTFYIHYRSKEDLLSEGLNDLRDALAASAHFAPRKQPLPFVKGLLEHMAEQRQVFRSVIGRRSGQGVERRFREMVGQLIMLELEKRKLPKPRVQMLARYLAGGIVEVMAWCVDQPRAPALGELESSIQDLAAAIDW
jgi:AcrR family transcriptional regulator